MDSVFEQAKARLQATLPFEQRGVLSGCSRDDVEKTIADIQRRWGAKRRLRHMNRLSKFLEAMGQLGQVVEVYLNVDSTVALIWGPIKFLLSIANTWLDSLDTILETYAEIGEILPPLKQYQSLFKRYPFIISYLPGQRHRDLLTEEKLTAVHAELQDIRGDVEDHIVTFAKHMKERDDAEFERVAQQEKASKKLRINDILSKLDPPDYLMDYEHAVEQWRTSDSGRWVLTDDVFQEWLGFGAQNILYLNGIPGAGKSILVSRIIHYLQQIRFTSDGTPAFSLVYFYFKHTERQKQNLAAFLTSAVAQLIRQDDGIIDYVYSQCCATDQPKIRSTSKLLEILQVIVRAQKSCRFVLDGLDECVEISSSSTSTECENILDALFSLCSSDTSSDEQDGYQSSLRILVSGQRDGILDRKFDGFPSVNLEKSPAHSADIEAYAEVMIQKISEKFQIQKDIRSLIADGIRKQSKGMFLYTKIVLSNLFHQVSVAGLKQELHADVFPKGLKEAYERVVVNVFDNPRISERHAATHIINLVAVAERPLRWKEIQAMFCIDVDHEKSDPDARLLVHCKTLCRSLVDSVGPRGVQNNANDTIHLVHSTLLRFLVQTGRVSLGAEHRKMARFCGLYLGSRCLSQTSSKETLVHAIATGYLGLHDYAFAFWYDHFAFSIRQMQLSQEGDQDEIESAAMKIWNLSQRQTRKATAPAADVGHPAIDWFLKLPQDPRERYASIPAIKLMIEAAQVGIETAQSLEKDKHRGSVLDVFYGPLNYKCTRPWCENYFTGFAERKQRDRHVQEHDTPFRCEEESCYANSIGFSTEEKLVKHEQSVHSEGTKIRFPDAPSSGSRRTGLGTAVYNGDLALVKSLVKNGANINAPSTTYNGAPPLYLAAHQGHFEICKYLLSSGADVNLLSAPYDNQSALIIATLKGHLDLVDLLLSQDGVDPWHRDAEEWSALGQAVRKGHLDIVNVFIARLPENELCYNEAGPDESTVLSLAILHGREEMVRLYLQHFPFSLNLNESFGNGERPFHLALRHGQDKIAQLFLSVKNGIRSREFNMKDRHGQLPLHAAASGGCREMSLFLLPVTNCTDEEDFKGLTPFHCAAEAGESIIMSHFLDDYEVDVSNTNADDQCCIMSAIGLVPCTLVHRMLRLDSARLDGHDTNKGNLLHYACYAGDAEAVKILLACPIDINATMDHWPQAWEAHWPRPRGCIGLTAITCAMTGYQAEEERREILEMLIETGRLKLPLDNQMQILQTCSRIQDGILLWKLVHSELPQLSNADRLSTIFKETAPLEGLYRCLVRDQHLAKSSILLEGKSARQTLKSCFECLSHVDPARAASLLLESASLPFIFPTSASEDLVVYAFQNNRVDVLEKLKKSGLIMADVIEYIQRTSNYGILQWVLQSDCFDGNEVDDMGRSVFVDACVKGSQRLVEMLLDEGVQTKHIMNAIAQLSRNPNRSTDGILKLLRKASQD